MVKRQDGSTVNKAISTHFYVGCVKPGLNMPPLNVIQCRFKSSRLPGKALYPLAGMPMIVFLIRRLKKANLPGTLILATTERKEDDIISVWGQAEDVPVVRGPDDDVLGRYLKCLTVYPFGFVIRITADNPLTDPALISQVSREMEQGGWDYVSAFEDFPVGVGVDGLSADLLKNIAKKARNNRDREHINAYVLDHEDKFSCHKILPPIELARPDVRLTVDTLEDWRRVSDLIDNFGPKLDIESAIKRSDKLTV